MCFLLLSVQLNFFRVMYFFYIAADFSSNLNKCSYLSFVLLLHVCTVNRLFIDFSIRILFVQKYISNHVIPLLTSYSKRE